MGQSRVDVFRTSVDALRRVISLKQDYTAAYQMLGSALMSLGRKDEARRAWTEGIEVANSAGAWKARQHMEGLLAGAEDNSESGFCEA